MTQLGIGYLTQLMANVNRGKHKWYAMHEVYPLVRKQIARLSPDATVAMFAGLPGAVVTQGGTA